VSGLSWFIGAVQPELLQRLDVVEQRIEGLHTLER
jgi:hypothetical protein